MTVGFVAGALRRRGFTLRASLSAGDACVRLRGPSGAVSALAPTFRTALLAALSKLRKSEARRA